MSSFRFSGGLFGKIHPVQPYTVLATGSNLILTVSEVPKSGEVWCEGARLHLNPLGSCFDIVTASQYLNFAILFTPQYGDSFIERLRLEILVAASGYDGDATELDLLSHDYEKVFRK